MNTPPDPTLHSEKLGQAMQALRAKDHVLVTSLVRELLEANPENADALFLLGMNAHAMNRHDLAVNLIGKAIARNPGQPYYLFNLAGALSALGETGKARECLLTAIRLKPDMAEAHVNLGNLLFGNGERRAAAEHYLAGLRLNPRLETGYYNLGVIFQEYGDQAAALEQFDQALSLTPDNAQAHMGRAHSLLKTGAFAEGWREYEWRFRLPNHAPRICPVPRWDGSETLEKKRIYVYTEQGFGDALMFARYAPLLRERGATVLLECRPELESLFAASGLAERVHARGLEDEAPPPFDYDLHIPLMSLPALLGTTLETIPRRVPYLAPPPERVAEWGARLGEKREFRVGLSWSGNPATSVNRERACALTDLLPLLSVPGTAFYSVQKGVPAAQLTPMLAERHAIRILEPELHDFAATGAALRQLDLLISTDTAVVHLAGGLGVPVWTLLHHASEWRWLEGRGDCPWYPSMRLFRQRQAGDWAGVVEQVRNALLDQLSSTS
ncbi:MAG: tetratricopeptide repeat protein [Magnetococcales bacterium]|nr:tetratricopeptide repeat protein [Magnetococcales bacterium]